MRNYFIRETFWMSDKIGCRYDSHRDAILRGGKLSSNFIHARDINIFVQWIQMKLKEVST